MLTDYDEETGTFYCADPANYYAGSRIPLAESWNGACRGKSQDAVIAKVKKIMVEDELLNLKYKKVYILPCQKEKILLPAHVFNKNTLGDMYRICLQPQKNDILLYRKIKSIESYLV